MTTKIYAPFHNPEKFISARGKFEIMDIQVSAPKKYARWRKKLCGISDCRYWLAVEKPGED